MKSAIEVSLPDGRKVVLAELSISEMKRAAQLAGKEPEASRAFEQGLQSLRLALRKIDERPIAYADIVGEQLDALFSVRDVSILMAAFGQIHGVTREEEASILGNVRAIAC